MLTTVYLKDFKNHISTEIKLGRLTCLVGPNGSGKTSVLEAVHFVATTLNRGAVSFFKTPYRFEDFVRKGGEQFTVGVDVVGGVSNDEWIGIELGAKEWDSGFDAPNQDEVALGFRVNIGWETNWEGVETDFPVWAQRWSGEDVTRGAWTQSHVPFHYETLKPTSFLFSPNIAGIRSPSYSSEEVPSLSADGSTLASVIAYLITTDPERFEQLLGNIRAVLPTVKRLRTRPAKVVLEEFSTVTTRGKEIRYPDPREVIGHELLFDLQEGSGIPARAVSEGTLLVTALLTATVWSQGADVLLIDDLEKGLHPKAQRELVTALKALLANEPELQIAFSTHSPYIVDELEPDQVWILLPDPDLGVISKRLSDHPRAADALQVLTTGEFLSAEGEEWVRDSAGTL